MKSPPPPFNAKAYRRKIEKLTIQQLRTALVREAALRDKYQRLSGRLFGTLNLSLNLHDEVIDGISSLRDTVVREDG